MISSQGVYLSFGGADIGKLTDVDGEFSTPLKTINPLDSGAVDEAGRYLPIYNLTTCESRLTVSALAQEFDTSAVGSTGELVASGDGWSICFPKAVMESIKITAKVGDYVRVSYTFRRSS